MDFHVDCPQHLIQVVTSYPPESLASQTFSSIVDIITMLKTFTFPTYFGIPFATDIPGSRYDSKGRQLSFVETEIQHLERMAFVNASSKSPNSLPTYRPPPSYPLKMNFIAEPRDPIELMANRLAEEYILNDFSSLLDEKLQILPPKSSPTPSSLQPGHGRKRGSLSSIPEED